MPNLAVTKPSPRAEFPAVASESKPMGLRCPRKSVIVFAGGATASDQPARVLEQTRAESGMDTTYVGTQEDESRSVELVADEGADAVELCLAAGVSCAFPSRVVRYGAPPRQLRPPRQVVMAA
jgi:hypothetical protein